MAEGGDGGIFSEEDLLGDDGWGILSLVDFDAAYKKTADSIYLNSVPLRGGKSTQHLHKTTTV